LEAIIKPEIRNMFDVSDDEQRLFLCFGFYLAMSVGALVSLKRKDISEVNLEDKTFKLTWIAKGNRRITKTFNNWEDLPENWLDGLLKMRPEEYLFKGRKMNDHVSVRTAQRWMKRLGKECAIQVGLGGASRITPHDLRHSGATIIAEASGGNQYLLREHLHHKNVGMSEHYVHATKKTSKERENMLRVGKTTPEQFRHK
jgi:integrase